MCMDEFVKRLYDFMGIYRIFWSQNSYYRYFTDILLIFFQKFQHKRTCSTIAIFRWKNRYFPICWQKIGDFTDFSSDRFFLCFSSQCWPKTDFSAIYRPKKTIFCSLVSRVGVGGGGGCVGGVFVHTLFWTRSD